MIDKQRYDQSIDELEHYSFLEVIKPTKKRDGKKKSFTLRVDLDELVKELQNHPALYNDEHPKPESEAPKKDIEAKEIP